MKTNNESAVHKHVRAPCQQNVTSFCWLIDAAGIMPSLRSSDFSYAIKWQNGRLREFVFAAVNLGLHSTKILIVQSVYLSPTYCISVSIEQSLC
jgi:hypothetical protein